MEELDPRLAGTADYLRKIVAQLASIVSRLEPEESNNEYASLKSDVLDLRLMIKAVIERLDDPAYVVKMPNRDEIVKRMENASADDERNKRFAALEAKVQSIAELQWSAERAVKILGNENISRHSSIVVNAHNISQLQDSINKIAKRLEALEKRNTAIDNLCGRLEALEKDVKDNTVKQQLSEVLNYKNRPTSFKQSSDTLHAQRIVAACSHIISVLCKSKCDGAIDMDYMLKNLPSIDPKHAVPDALRALSFIGAWYGAPLDGLNIKRVIWNVE